MKISEVKAREILDSRGNPTIEAEIILQDGTRASASIPSGASTGKFEAYELRDKNKKRYFGKGVLKAVKNVNKYIAKRLVGKDVEDLSYIDSILNNLDKSERKTHLGANSTLAVSIAAAKAASKALNLPLYRYLGGIYANTLPIPMMNIINGGKHAANSLDIQEFMIIPISAPTFKEGLRACSEVYHTLKNILKCDGEIISVGDEGGFAPNLKSHETAIEYILKAIKFAGYKTDKDFMIALDAAASEWKSPKGKGYYLLPKSGITFTTDELIEYWKSLSEKYPIYSLEDGLDEDDWQGWQNITERLGNNIKLVGDDLFTTNKHRLQKGIETKCANSILIKPNQIGTLTQTLETIKMAQKSGYKVIISHRSGETCDTTIADLSVAVNAEFIKSGAPTRGERVAKYNRLLNIEETCLV